ncbi:MAG: hypothetical protein R3F49_25620 [Planctomycetota bacterium]
MGPPITTRMLLDTARVEARGQTPIGGVRFVELAEGQRAEASIDPGAGACVTVLAHAGLGVREVDLFLRDPADGHILAQDGERGPAAIVGGRRGCVRAAAGGPVSVAVLAREGRGAVVVGVFAGPTAIGPDAAPVAP